MLGSNGEKEQLTMLKENLSAISNTLERMLENKQGGKELFLKAFLEEYKECVQSYRHTYQTIWQAAGIFLAISAGFFALAVRDSAISIELVRFLAFLPFLFWFWGIFVPMNSYGKIREKAIVEIEKHINCVLNKVDKDFLRSHMVGSFARYLEDKKNNIISVTVSTWIIGVVSSSLCLWSFVEYLKK